MGRMGDPTIALGDEKCKEWMEYFKGHSVPGVSDQQSRLQVLRRKEEVARTEIEDI